MARPALLARLRRRAIKARTPAMRALWRRALERRRRNYLSQTIAFDGVPTMRGLAILLQHARGRGWNGRLNSSDRRKGVAERYGHQSQAALYAGWAARRPGFNPANPPGRSSHELRSDGNPIFGKPVGAVLSWYELGVDADEAEQLRQVLREMGVDARRPYQTVSEAHHLNVLTDPTAVLVRLEEA